MKMEEFAHAVLTAVSDKANGDFNARITEHIKNNGIRLTGISTSYPKNNSGPCVYLDGYYRECQNGNMDIHAIAESVYSEIIDHRDDLKDINAADFLQWDTIKHHIYAKLVNAARNKDTLRIVPHREFLDLAVVYYIKVDKIANCGTASILIQCNYMQMWGQDEENLFRTAVSNMRSDNGPLFIDMETMLLGILPGCADSPDKDTGIEMYVLTSQDKTFGAAEILDTNTLKQISDKLGDDYAILPSSIHETIIIPLKKSPSYPLLANIVCEINETAVDEEERLSDHVYIYRRNEGALKMAA